MTPTTLAADAAQALQGVTPDWIVYGEPEVGMTPSLFSGTPGTEGFHLLEPLSGRNLLFAEFARAWVPEAAAALTATTATMAELTRERDQQKADANKWFDQALSNRHALEAAEAKVARLEEALTLAANRLQRRAVDYVPGGRLFIETSEWAQEARAALTEGTPE